MNRNFLLISLLLAVSCSESATGISSENIKNTKIRDSINVARTRYNDSISIANQKNIFGDLTGKKTLKFTDDFVTFNGNVNFIKVGRDQYDVVGKAVAGKNKVSLSGVINRVSEKHLNFEGRISQVINGKKFVRARRTTFMDEGKGNFWRLQNKVNGEGFVEYIDIYF
ncbi:MULTISPECIES: hypothetical protein [Chryseobacterium]|uniref:hypothetical protein n=1 Tax=Chryseobacterium sp. R2A-55 TaxID=2744445 RepID=UPI001F15ACC5|nr:hypothetical protein [Chryseobacterium sp. R2A-55]